MANSISFGGYAIVACGTMIPELNYPLEARTIGSERLKDVLISAMAEEDRLRECEEIT